MKGSEGARLGLGVIHSHLCAMLKKRAATRWLWITPLGFEGRLSGLKHSHCEAN
jgi:hypothetical protein